MKKITWILALLGMLTWAGCFGVQSVPLHSDESIDLNFDGPVTITYLLADGTPVNRVVEQELTLVLENRYDDGDTTQSPKAESLITYFRLDARGGELHLGLDPEAKNPVNGNLLFPDPLVIADYANLAQFEFSNQAGGRLENSAPIRMDGNFLGATAFRHQYSCVDPNGNTAFVYDLSVFKLCLQPKHVEASTDLTAYPFTRAQIAALTPENQRTFLATVPQDNLVDRPPLVLRIVNTSFDPNANDAPADAGMTGDADADGNLGVSSEAGGCSLGGGEFSTMNGIGWGILLAVAMFRRAASKS